jgi:predicted CoA-binding protein
VASTLTIYVNPKISHQMQDEILKYPAKRVIFNPGTENFELAEKLRQKGVEVLEACTLVMLKTGQF